jgi:hypothetical protein
MTNPIMFDEIGNLKSNWFIMSVSSNNSNCLISTDSCNTFMTYDYKSNSVIKNDFPILYGGYYICILNDVLYELIKFVKFI